MLNIIFNQIFLPNKYSNCYYSIIKNALQSERVKLAKKHAAYVYYEMHHIIPKSIKPEYKDTKVHGWNRVLLTPKEHFICHLLLTKMLTSSDKNKMVYALWGMTNQASKFQGQRFKSNMYATYKIKMQESLSSDRKGKSLIELYGEEKAASIKENMKDRKTRRKMTVDEKHAIGQKFKAYHAANPGHCGFNAKPQLEKVKCGCCGMIVDPGNYSRHHGANCKRITTVCPTCSNTFSSTPWENKKYCCKECSKQGRRKDAFVDLI